MHRDAAAFPDLAGSVALSASKTPQIERFSTAGPQKKLCGPAALLHYGKEGCPQLHKNHKFGRFTSLWKFGIMVGIEQSTFPLGAL